MTKSRITKKLVALAATLLLLTMMVIPAVAAPGNPEGQITVTKYAGADLTGAFPNFTGEVATVDPMYTPIAGAGFTLYHIPDAQVQALLDGLTATIKVASHSIDTSGATPVITWTLTNATTVSATATTIALGAEQFTPATGEITFGDGTPTGSLPDGYYILEESTVPPAAPGNPPFLPAAPALIRMPMTTTGGLDNYHVYVYPKNISSGGIANKDLGDGGTSEPIAKDDWVDFEIKSKFLSATVNSVSDLRLTAAPSLIPGDYGTAAVEEYFNDYFISTGLDSDIEVFWIDAFGELTGTALPTSHYTITRPAPTPGLSEIVRVELTMAGIDAAIAAAMPGFGFTISAQYQNGPTAQEGETPVNVSNSMGSIIAAPSIVPPPPIIDTIHVPTISITVEKVDENGAPLIGATFKLSTVGINPQPSDFVKDQWGVDLEATTTLDANGDATVSFSNLPGYSNATGAKYYVIETAAPSGYNGGTVVSVQWNNKATHQGLVPSDFHPVTGHWAENINLVKSILVANTRIGTPNPDSPGFSLPLTGGAGTLLFTAIGIVVMLGAAGAYLHGKKKNV